MLLREALTAETVNLSLNVADRDAAIAAAVALLRLDRRSELALLKVLIRREGLGSTGVGRGIAIPHCRSLVVPRLRMAYARLVTPIPWDAIDGRPVRHLFLIAAPPNELSNQYLPTLGHLAGFAREAANLDQLDRVATPEDLFSLLARSSH